MYSIIWGFDIVGEQLATYARMSNISQGVSTFYINMLKVHTEEI